MYIVYMKNWFIADMFCYLSQNAIKTLIYRRHVLMFISPECNMNNDSSSTCSVIYRQYAIKALIYRRYVLMFIASMQYEHQSSPTCSVANIIWFNTDMSCDISQNKLIHRKHVLMFISSMQYEHWFIADMFWCLYRQYFKKVFKRKEFELVFIVRWNFFCFI